MLNENTLKKMYRSRLRWDSTYDTFDRKIIDNFHRALKDRSMIFLRRTDRHMQNIDATTFRIYIRAMNVLRFAII